MSIDSDIATALAAVAGGQVYSDIAPEGTKPPFVVIERTSFQRVQVLQGAEGLQNSVFRFLCVGRKTETRRAKEDARTLAAAVRAAIEARKGSTLPSQFEVEVEGDDFAPEDLSVMEPVAFSFWHQA